MSLHTLPIARSDLHRRAPFVNKVQRRSIYHPCDSESPVNDQTNPPRPRYSLASVLLTTLTSFRLPFPVFISIQQKQTISPVLTTNSHLFPKRRTEYPATCTQICANRVSNIVRTSISQAYLTYLRTVIRFLLNLRLNHLRHLLPVHPKSTYAASYLLYLT